MSHSRHFIAGLLITACSVLSACTRDAASQAGQPPHDTLAIDLTIGGSSDDRPEYEFGRISGVVGAPEGGVIVVDHMNHVIRVYDRAGAHRFNIGREGAGPGELHEACCLAFDKAGHLWVRDGNARYNVYELSGDTAHYITQRRMAHADVNRWAPVTFDETGNVIDIGGRSDANAPRQTVRFHLDSTSTVVREEVLHESPQDSTAMKTVTRDMPGGGSITQYAYQPHGPQAIYAHGPGGVFAHAITNRYAIDWRDAHGQLLRHITYDLPQGPPLSARERVTADSSLNAQAQRMKITRAQLGFDAPASKSPLRALHFDRDGRLWVQLNVPDGDAPTAHVYDTTGRLERIITWPAGVNLTSGYLSSDAVWGVATDSLDVQSIVRLRPRR